MPVVLSRLNKYLEMDTLSTCKANGVTHSGARLSYWDGPRGGQLEGSRISDPDAIVTIM